MEKQFEYKGFSGSIEYSETDFVYFGKVINIPDLISYEGETMDVLEQSFKEAIDDYLGNIV